MTRFLTGDAAFTTLGCALALSSATFATYMTVHGPAVPLGTSGDFSVFAQLAPNPTRHARVPKTGTDDLDMTATATLTSSRDGVSRHAGVPRISPGIVLQAAVDDAAYVIVDGTLRRVHVGDSIPGAGEVLAIFPGEHAMVKTSRGIIASAHEDSR